MSDKDADNRAIEYLKALAADDGDYAFDALESILDELEQLQADWVRWNWDDSSTWPKAKGMYVCGSADDSLPAVDEWDGENFIHYGIYDYWKPYIGPKEQTK